MKRWIATILSVCVMLLGSGAVQHLHAVQHEREERALVGGQPPQPGDTPHHPAEKHPCVLCVQLHHPLLLNQGLRTLHLVAPGLGVLATVEHFPVAHLHPIRLVSRGPPQRSPII